jgi:hypothetical protein
MHVPAEWNLSKTNRANDTLVAIGSSKKKKKKKVVSCLMLRAYRVDRIVGDFLINKKPFERKQMNQ